MKIVWSPDAEQDLDEIFAYILADNPAAAVRVLDSIERAVSELATFPDLGRPGRVDDTRELVVAATPYIVAYEVRRTPGRIDVLAVIHGARLWPESFE